MVVVARRPIIFSRARSDNYARLSSCVFICKSKDKKKMEREKQGERQRARGGEKKKWRKIVLEASSLSGDRRRIESSHVSPVALPAKILRAPFFDRDF